MADTQPERRARDMLAAYALSDSGLSPIDGGLINRSFVVERAGERWVLQWVNPLFGPAVHEDIEAVTAHLARSGVTTPRLVRTRSGELSARDADGGSWRLLTWVDGVTHQRATSAAMCESAGRLVGRFHLAVSTLRHTFAHRRPFVHDTVRHFAHLREVLDERREHRNYGSIEHVGREILARGSDLPQMAGLPAHIVHGDLKISNVLFSPAGEARALVDLDTLAEMPVPVELGDAWRSWCNPRGEDETSTRLELDYLAAALEGYAREAGELLTEAEVAALPTAIETIALELAARFCADAIDESYFGWDRRRFASASEHNLLRARGQLALARSCASERARIEAVVARTLGSRRL